MMYYFTQQKLYYDLFLVKYKRYNNKTNNQSSDIYLFKKNLL